MYNLKSKIKVILFIAALSATPLMSLNANLNSNQLIAEKGGGGGHGGGGEHGGGGGGRGDGGGRGGGGEHRGGGDWGRGGGEEHRGGDWGRGGGDWDHHGGDWDRHRDRDWDGNYWRGNDDFYGFGIWGYPNGYNGYQNTDNCYYYQAADGNWYYTCSGY
jgi:hypothetical protein